MIDKFDNESIFIGESAEDRNRKRESLASIRLENLRGLKTMTERLKIKATTK